MKEIAILVVVILGASRVAQGWTKLSQNEVSAVHEHVSSFINDLISPIKQADAHKSMQNFWAGDRVKSIRNRVKIFERFTRTFNKHYNRTEVTKRKQVFLDRYNEIENWHHQYRQGKVSFDMEINDMADRTEDELDSLGNSLPVPSQYAINTTTSNRLSASRSSSRRRRLTLPASKSWRRYFTAVRDQEDCGCCYAFATVDALSAQKAIKEGRVNPTKKYSVQQIVDCSEYTHGCNGGWPTYALDYIKSAGGLANARDYPYTAEEDYCSITYKRGSPSIEKFQGPEYKILRSERQFKEHIAYIGPVIATMRPSTRFDFYRRGIFDDTTCSRRLTNHAIIVVGYGSENGKDYWLIRNSYGDDWGEDGYMKMLRGKNLCLIGEWGVGIVKV